MIDDPKYDRQKVGYVRKLGNLKASEARRIAFEWLGERVNTFVNVLRPRIREYVADQGQV